MKDFHQSSGLRDDCAPALSDESGPAGDRVSAAAVSDYSYSSTEETCAHSYVADRVLRVLKETPGVARVLDAGCGNGSLAARIAHEGFSVYACDTSTSGIAQGRRAFPNVRFEVASVYDDLRALFGETFDACVSTEVVEHLYDPRRFVSRVFDILRPGGLFVLTTPYHGYLKNLALALSGKMDNHYTALWDGGHIKFWSRRTLATLLEEAGFNVVGFQGLGRLPFLWKSMIVVARKPRGESAMLGRAR